MRRSTGPFAYCRKGQQEIAQCGAYKNLFQALKEHKPRPDGSDVGRVHSFEAEHCPERTELVFHQKLVTLVASRLSTVASPRLGRTAAPSFLTRRINEETERSAESPFDVAIHGQAWLKSARERLAHGIQLKNSEEFPRDSIVPRTK